MRLAKIQQALKEKKIEFDYVEEDGLGSLDFLFRGLNYHVWEYEDEAAETNVFHAGRTIVVEGDYEQTIAEHILSWPDMIG